MKKYIAECIGTFVLVVFGCGTAVIVNSLLIGMGMGLPQGFTILAISVAFGLAIVAMAYSIGNVSGCHINPAVSTGMLVAGRMSVQDFIGYVISQFIGATLGAAFLWAVLQENTSLGQNGYGQSSVVGIDASRAMVVEIVLTFIFVLVILAVTSKKQFEAVAGLVIGLTLTVIHLFGIPLTGTSVNPARSFGPAVITAFDNSDALVQLPVFIIAPLIGGILAAIVFRYLMEEPEEAEEAEEATVYSESQTNVMNDNVIYQGGTEAKRLESKDSVAPAARESAASAETTVLASRKAALAVPVAKKAMARRSKVRAKAKAKRVLRKKTYAVKTTKDAIKRKAWETRAEAAKSAKPAKTKKSSGSVKAEKPAKAKSAKTATKKADTATKKKTKKESK